MPHKIRRSRLARADQSAIWLHIAQDSVPAADIQMDKLHNAFVMLADFPLAGRVRPDLGEQIRSLPIESYNVFYRVRPTVIEIVRILHSARNVTPDLLDD